MALVFTAMYQFISQDKLVISAFTGFFLTVYDMLI